MRAVFVVAVRRPLPRFSSSQPSEGRQKPRPSDVQSCDPRPAPLSNYGDQNRFESVLAVTASLMGCLWSDRLANDSTNGNPESHEAAVRSNRRQNTLLTGVM